MVTFQEFKDSLVQEAETPIVKQVNNSILLSHYISYGYRLIQKIESLGQYSIQNVTQKYIELMRFVCLYVNVISKHNARPQINYSSDLRNLKKRAKEYMDQLESLSKDLLHQYFVKYVAQDDNNIAQMSHNSSGIHHDNNISSVDSKKNIEHSLNHHHHHHHHKQSSKINMGKCIIETNKYDHHHNISSKSQITSDNVVLSHDVIGKDEEISIPHNLQHHPNVHPSNKQIHCNLKTVFANRRIVDDFLSYAFENLEKDLELCGILCGYLNLQNVLSTTSSSSSSLSSSISSSSTKTPSTFQNDSLPQLIITHCIIPSQTFSNVSCHVTEQGLNDLFQYQVENNLITIGWIHIHPTQTAFLSSVDLETQFSYQSLLPETIAIVCAPKHHPNIGIFRIKDSYSSQCKDHINGMAYLQEKIKHGPAFATKFEHVQRTLFETCSHCNLSYNIKIPYHVIDLRK